MTDPVWLELLNKRLDIIDAQMTDVLRRLGAAEKRLTEHRRLIDNVDQYIARLEAGAEKMLKERT